MSPTQLLTYASLLALAASSAQQPVFRSSTDLILVDVQVSDRRWQPVTDLAPTEFQVEIDGKPRTVLSSEFVSISGARSTETPVDGAALAAVSPISRPRPSTEGRTLILAVDQSSLQITNEPAAIEAVTRLLAMASPLDRIGLVAYPQPGISLAPTMDRGAVRDALKGIGGQFFTVFSRYQVSLSEAVDMQAGDRDITQMVVRRECRNDGNCPRDIAMVAAEIALNAEIQALRSISGLKSVIQATRDWPGRKTLVVISAGIATSDRIGGRPDIRLEADNLGRQAAEANAVIYTLHLDVAFLTQFSAKNRSLGQTVYRDAALAANGLERFTGSAGGSLITVHAGPDQALKRLLQETSAYYLLGIEATPADRDGKTHRIQVKVKRGGATVRARSTVFIPKVQ